MNNCSLSISRQWCKAYYNSTCSEDEPHALTKAVAPCAFDGRVDWRFLLYWFLNNWYASELNRYMLAYIGAVCSLALLGNAVCVATFRRLQRAGESVDANQLTIVVANTLSVISVWASFVQSDMISADKHDAFCLNLAFARVWAKIPAIYYSFSLGSVLLLVGICYNRRTAIENPIQYRNQAKKRFPLINFVISFGLASLAGGLMMGNWPAVNPKYEHCDRHRLINSPSDLKYSRFCLTIGFRPKAWHSFTFCAFEYGRGLVCKRQLRPDTDPYYSLSASDAAFAKARYIHLGYCVASTILPVVNMAYYVICVVAYGLLVVAALSLLYSYRRYEQQRKSSVAKNARQPIKSRTFTVLLLLEILLSFLQFIVMICYFVSTNSKRFFEGSSKGMIDLILSFGDIFLLLGAAVTTVQLSGNVFFYLATSRTFRRHFKQTLGLGYTAAAKASVTEGPNSRRTMYGKGPKE